MAAVESRPVHGPTTQLFEPKCPKPKLDREFSRTQIEEERKFFSFKNLQFELIRLLTFKNWLINFIAPRDLAKNGLFYMQKDDFVQCHFCRGVIGYWEKGDDPKVEHEKHFPNCPFVQGSAVTNIPLDETPLNNMLMNYLKDRMKDCMPPPRKRTYQTDSAIVHPEEKTNQYPDYTTEEKRRASFPPTKQRIPDVEKMVKAGLFMIGLGDMTQCYSCGGGIFNWSVDEDPAEIHDSLYPNCRLAKKRKHVAEDTEMEGVTSNKRKITEEERELLLELPVAKKMLGSGWPKEMVSGTLAYELNRYGTLPIDVNEANDAIFDYEEMIEAGEDDGFL